MGDPVSAPANLTADSQRLSGFLRSIGSFSEDLILSFGTTETLHHYTNLDGLLAILSSGDLRLTHSRYCNDEAEMTHGLALASEVLADERSKATDPNRQVYLDELLRLSKETAAEPVYIACFCESLDRLSQWRAYGANGTGVSLEFEPAQFSYITGPDLPPNIGLMRFWKVFYPRETQRKIIRSAINYYPNFEPTAAPNDWASWTWEAIRFFLPTFKHQDFSEEEEWRLIFTPSQGVPVGPSYRVARGMLVPYYSLRELSQAMGYPNRNLPLRSLRIGPSPNKALNLVSARMLLDKYGYQHVTVSASSIPYRG